MSKEKCKYYVVFQGIKEGGRTLGAIEILIDKALNTISDINEISEFIKKDQHLKSVLILNWKELESE